MYRLLFFAPLLALLACRAPAIPDQPTPREYAVYRAWIEQASSVLPRPLAFVIDASTLTLDQNQLQYQQCLPPRMATIFDTAPAAVLSSTSSTSGNDWLSLDNGRRAQLQPHDQLLALDRPTKLFRLSRVAFTLSGFDAFFWVEHRDCQSQTDLPSCGPASGLLVHGIKSNGAWTFEDTVCQITSPTL